MDEEQVTEAVEEHLTAAGWTMFAVDYPTSGSGLRLHPDDRDPGTKHAGSVVPDIVAYRDQQLIVVESKPYFDRADAKKLADIAAGAYSESLERRVYATTVETVTTALAFPKTDRASVDPSVLDAVDSLFLVGADGSVVERVV